MVTVGRTSFGGSFVLALAACAGGGADAGRERPEPAPRPAAGAPVVRLHGHNDYLQPRPLQTALELSLGSVEADVFLVDGELRVGHERWQLRPGRTLASLYLEPLVAFARAHGGRVRSDGEPFVLLVDIKADAASVWPVLHAELARIASEPGLLTRFAGDRCEVGAVTVLLSGARPFAEVAAAGERWCALDGRPSDLERVPLPSPTLVPWISEAWTKVSTWRGYGELEVEERERIRALAAVVHAAGRELRFWGAPDRPEAWALLRELGVDRLGTDRPKAAAAWLAGSVR